MKILKIVISLLWLAGAVFVARLYFGMVAPEKESFFILPLAASAVLLAVGLHWVDVAWRLWRSVLAGLMVLASFLLLFGLFFLRLLLAAVVG
jgi:hypothetical protein